MLNKNRMMVFKNKGKDLEVSESLLYQTDGLAEPLRAIRNYILLAKTRASRRPRVRLLFTIWCHFFFFPPRTRTCTRIYVANCSSLFPLFSSCSFLSVFLLLFPSFPPFFFFSLLSAFHIVSSATFYLYIFFPISLLLLLFFLFLFYPLLSSILLVASFITYIELLTTLLIY